MQAAYTLTRDDLLEYHEACVSRSQQVRPWLQRVAAGFLGGVGVLGLVTFLGPIRGVTTPPVTYLLIYLALVVLSVYSLWQLSCRRLGRWVDRQVRSGVYVLGEYVISLDSEGVEEITPTGRSKVPWQNVVGLSQDASSLSVAYQASENVRSFVTPKRAFLSPSAASAFYGAAMSYWQAAKNGVPQASPTEEASGRPHPAAQSEAMEITFRYTPEDIKTYYDDYAALMESRPGKRKAGWNWDAVMYLAVLLGMTAGAYFVVRFLFPGFTTGHFLFEQ